MQRIPCTTQHEQWGEIYSYNLTSEVQNRPLKYLLNGSVYFALARQDR